MRATQDDLFDLLKRLGIETRTVCHPPLFTVADSQKLRGEIAGAHTKNLFLRDRKDRHFLVTLGEEAVVDLKTIHSVIGASGKVSFGKPEALMEHLGVVPGAVTPFGVINDKAGAVTMVLDRALMEHDIINAHPLTNEATTSIAREDLVRFLKEVGHEPLVLAVSIG